MVPGGPKPGSLPEWMAGAAKATAKFFGHAGPSGAVAPSGTGGIGPGGGELWNQARGSGVDFLDYLSHSGIYSPWHPRNLKNWLPGDKFYNASQ
jgi:hypothetical protein